MSLDVYINNNLLELKQNKGIGLTFQIGSILNPGNRAGNLSNKFKVPKSRKNTEILGNLSNINSATNIPYQRNSGKIIQDGIEIISDGFAIVDSTDKEYGITIYSGNVSFFDLIKGRNISELDLSDLCEDWTVANVIARFSATDGFTYPIIDWGKDINLLDNTTLQNSNALIPSLFMKEVLIRIADSVGYEIKGTFPNFQQWDRLLLTPNQFGYLETEINKNTGVSKDVTQYPLTELEIPSVCSSGINSNLILNLPLIYQDIEGDNFNPVTGDTFTPDNKYFGNFNLTANGSIYSEHIPIKGETVIQSGINYNDFRSGNINDNYSNWINSTTSFINANVWLKNLSDTSLPLLIDSSSFSSQGRSAMTETNGGFVAYSLESAGITEVRLYDILNATNIQIYLNNSATGTADFLKIWNGKVIIGDQDPSGGIFVYDILTSTLKTVKTTNDFVLEFDSNGDFVVWNEPSSNNIYLWDFLTSTNTLIENQGVFSGVATVNVLGDYATYWDQSLDKMVSYKISTNTLTNILIDPLATVQGSARSETKLSFAKNTGQLYYYDLVTNTLTTPLAVTNCTVLGVTQADQLISMNEDFIFYRYLTNNQVNAYEISTGIDFVVAIESTFIEWAIIGNCSNITSHHVANLVDQINQFDITSGSPILFETIPGINILNSFKKTINNDRLLFTNVSGNTSSVLNKVSIIEPVQNTVSVAMELVIKENGIIIYSDSEIITTSLNGNLFNLVVNPGTIIVNSGDVYSAELFIDAVRDETINYFINYSLTESEFSFIPNNSIPYGAKLNLENYYDLDQEKPFKDVMNQFGLTVQTDEVKKQIVLTPLDELNNNLAEAKNWNDKINLNKIPTVKYLIGSYAQTNYFIYKEDDDVLENLGRGSFTINNTSLEVSKNIIQLNSCAVESGLRLLNESTPTIPLQTFEGSFFDKAKPRILLLDKINKSVSWKNTINGDVGTSTILPLCYFNKVGKNDNLDFTSLISENYNVLTGMLDRVKFISADFRLNEVDIANLNFTIPVYLNINNSEININGYFYINKISNFQEGKPTKVDLIRL